MHINEFINNIESSLYDGDLELNEQQCEFIDQLMSHIRSSLPCELNYSEEQFKHIIFLIGQKTIYHNSDDVNIIFLTELTHEINHILMTNQTSNNVLIAPSSLLAALYYLNDIIAASSAMGRGSETAIKHELNHTQVMARIFKQLQSDKKCLTMMNQCGAGSFSSPEKLLSLIFALIETQYLVELNHSITGTPQIKAAKMKLVDTFYRDNAECCMAKGSMWILRALTSFSTEQARALSRIVLDANAMNDLRQCSDESISLIQREIPSRRYRSGNSGHIWTDLRNSISIPPMNNYSISSISLLSLPTEPTSSSMSLETNNDKISFASSSY